MIRPFILFTFMLTLWAAAKCADASPVPIRLTWGTPNTYTDSTPLAKTSIAGYEVHYSVQDSLVVSRLVLPGSDRVSYDMDLPTQDVYNISVAVFLTDGTYSVYTPFKLDATGKQPGQVWLSVDKKTTDIIIFCKSDITCKVAF